MTREQEIGNEPKGYRMENGELIEYPLERLGVTTREQEIEDIQDARSLLILNDKKTIAYWILTLALNDLELDRRELYIEIARTCEERIK